MNKNLKERAITLIALTITIVVLIILAGVAINLSLGQNGLFNKAKTASEEYTNAQGKEETEIAKVTNEIDSFLYSSRGNNISYSLEEQDTGLKWIDNKQIYQKTFSLKMPKITTNGTLQQNTISISDLNIDVPISANGIIEFIGSGNYKYYDFFNAEPPSENKYIRINTSTGILYYGSASTNSSECKCYITIQYTKK